LLGLKAIASRIRQLLVSIVALTASNQHIIEQMRPTDFIRHIPCQVGSMGFALPTPQREALTPQGPPLL
jgi:hypothetical protein